MAKRFNNLKAALRLLQTPTGGSNNEPPAGSVLARYKDFRDGKTDVEYPRAASSRPGSLQERMIQPFGYALNARKTIVPVSKRATDRLADAIETAANLSTDLDGAARAVGFIPAKATIRTGMSASGTTQTSKITGLKYISKGGGSATIPYGIRTGKLTESEVRGDILQAAGATALVSFTSERL